MPGGRHRPLSRNDLASSRAAPATAPKRPETLAAGEIHARRNASRQPASGMPVPERHANTAYLVCKHGVFDVQTRRIWHANTAYLQSCRCRTAGTFTVCTCARRGFHALLKVKFSKKNRPPKAVTKGGLFERARPKSNNRGGYSNGCATYPRLRSL